VQGDILTDQAAAWAKLKALIAKTTPPANTVYAGIGTDQTVLGFYPKVLRVKAGTTVTFVNKSGSEPHNAGFGPQKYIGAFMKKTDLTPTGPKAPNQVTPAFIYGSDPKSANAYDGSNHGNGFFATQLSFGSSAVPLPRMARVTFTKAGTYKYICMIH